MSWKKWTRPEWNKTVIFPVDYGLLFGEAPIHIFDQNKMYADIAKRHEGRLIPFMAIDPRRPGALRHCEQAFHEWGVKGFKLHAGVGYMPDDPCCYWVYEKAAEWNIPIMVHTGGAPNSTPSLRWECSRPAYFATAAARYPETDFIFAHCGGVAWWQEAVDAAVWLPNVYLDLSLWQKPYKKWPKPRFYQWLRDVVDLAGADKFMFATDALYPNLMCPPGGMGACLYGSSNGYSLYRRGDRPDPGRRRQESVASGFVSY